MSFLGISDKRVGAKAARVSSAGIDAKKLAAQLTAKKSKPTKKTWRVLTLKDGRQIATRKNYSYLTRWCMGIRPSDETGAYRLSQQQTAAFLHQQLGGEDLAAALAYFSSTTKVRDTHEFRQHNLSLANAQVRLGQKVRLEQQLNAAEEGRKAKEQDIRERVVPMIERRLEAMHRLRADLMTFSSRQLQQLPKRLIGDELALELNELVGQPLEEGAPLNEAQVAALRQHIDGTSNAGGTTPNKTIESLLLRLPTARLLHESVFLALVDYYQDWAERYLKAQIAR